MADAAPQILERLAHDLRGPLSPLQTAAYLLRHENADEQRRRELLDIIERQTTRLSNMLQEVSDWNRAEQGRLVAHREVSELAMILELACAPPASATHRGDVRLQLDPAVHDLGIDGDVQRLVQMFGNLVAYALAAAPQARIDAGCTDPGEVRVRIRSHGGERPPGGVDELLSIPQQAPFDEGLGLRLLIAGAIARAHGGSVAAAGSRDGIEFQVRLPTA